MKKISTLVCLSFFLASTLMAQPIILEQASNVVPAKTLEVGIDNFEYGTDVTKITDTTLELTRTNLTAPVIARYGFTNDVEGLLTIPYTSLSSKTDNAGVSSTTSDAMLSDIQLAGKKSFEYLSWDMAFALGLSLPTGSQSDKFPAEFKKGFNIIPTLAASKEFSCPATGKALTLNANLSYDVTGEYDGKDSVKYDPSDILTVGAGLEHALTCSSCAKEVVLGAEVLYKSLSDQKVAGATLSGSAGSQLDLVLGGRCRINNNLKTKLGVAFSLGDEKYREFDWKILLGITYLVQI